MAIISIPYTFSAGATIIASQHNSNFTTIANDYNGNIDNTNIAAGAAIAYSKLNLTGNIVNADINASAAIANSKLNLASVSQDTTMTGKVLIGSAHQGDVFYDNGTQITRLTPGTSGQFLKTQGAAANPLWATISVTSNVIFSWLGIDDSTGTGNGNHGFTVATLLTTAQANFIYFWANTSNTPSTVVELMPAFYWPKISGVSTLTVKIRTWTGAAGGNPQVRLNGNSGSNVSSWFSITDSATPAWQNTFTLDVSGLTNGTYYPFLIECQDTVTAQALIRMSAIVITGS